VIVDGFEIETGGETETTVNIEELLT